MAKRRNLLDDFTATDPNYDDAEDWLKEAERFLDLAETHLKGDHADSVAHSSKTVEYAAKALLTLGGYEFPEYHWVGQGLKLVWRRIAGVNAEQLRLAKRQVARVGWLCDVVAPLQSISEYGYAGKRARFVINETDAATFYRYGKECIDIARRVATKVREGTFRIKTNPSSHA